LGGGGLYCGLLARGGGGGVFSEWVVVRSVWGGWGPDEVGCVGGTQLVGGGEGVVVVGGVGWVQRAGECGVCGGVCLVCVWLAGVGRWGVDMWGSVWCGGLGGVGFAFGL